MRTIPLTLEALQRQASDRSWERGESYYYHGAVGKLIQRGNDLEAQVRGSQDEPYFVRITLKNDEVSSAACNCPYDYEGWCKHIVATLLSYLRKGDRIEKRLPLAELLEPLDQSQLQELINYLVDEYPQLVNKIERHLKRELHISYVETSLAKTSHPHTATIDRDYYKKAIRSIIDDTVDGYRDDWDDGYEEDSETVEQLQNLLAEIEDFFAQEDFINAIAALEVITESCVDYWHKAEDYGIENHELAESLNSLWTEAVLKASLEPLERLELQDKLEVWQDQWNADFLMSIEALKQGWDYPPLQSLLSGEEPTEPLYPNGINYFANKLMGIRLRCLKEQERYEEYLNLARLDNQITEYLTLLAWLDRIELAMSEARRLITHSRQALALSKALQEQGATLEAIQIAQAGLSFTPSENPDPDLASWLLELALEIQDPDLILASRLKVFQVLPSVKQYEKIQACAGEDWELLKEDLIELIRSLNGWSFYETQITIFLREGLVLDAIAVADQLSEYQESLIKMVMKEAINIQPEWVITKAKNFAEPVMDQGKAERYQSAVDWLIFVKQAYFAMSKNSDWQTYYNNLKDVHQRKRKLMGLFKSKL